MSRNKLKTEILQPNQVDSMLSGIQTRLATLRDRGATENKQRAWRRLLIVFRLSFGCGLRMQEWGNLRFGDVFTTGQPVIRVKGEAGRTKGVRKGDQTVFRTRHVPLNWDSGTLDDIRAWCDHRRDQGVSDDHCVVGRWDNGGPLERGQQQRMFRQLYELIGPEAARRYAQQTHIARRTFASVALYRGRTLVEVSRALGHDSESTTSAYLGLIETGNEIPDLYQTDPETEIRERFPWLDRAPEIYVTR